MRYSLTQLQSMEIDDLDKLAFGYKNGEIISISPHDIVIQYQGDLLNPEEKFRLGGQRWVDSVDLSEPVSVSIDTDGILRLEDGHHRLFAATKRGLDLIAEIEIKGNPVMAILTRQRQPHALTSDPGGFSP